MTLKQQVGGFGGCNSLKICVIPLNTPNKLTLNDKLYFVLVAFTDKVNIYIRLTWVNLKETDQLNKSKVTCGLTLKKNVKAQDVLLHRDTVLWWNVPLRKDFEISEMKSETFRYWIHKGCSFQHWLNAVVSVWLNDILNLRRAGSHWRWSVFLGCLLRQHLSAGL